MPTAPAEAFPFCGPSNVAVSPVFDAQRSINLYPEFGLPSSKSKMMLVGTPGLEPFMTLPANPVRALWAGSLDTDGLVGRLFAVGGAHVYELKNDGTVKHDYGAIPGSGAVLPAKFKENGTQLLVYDPGQGLWQVDDGPTGTGPFVLNPVFFGNGLEYLDGFYISIAVPPFETANFNQINVSAPLDGTTWPGLAFGVRTGASDLVTQIAVVNNQLWVFGLKSIEVWYNAGTQPFPFARVTGATINLGLLARDSVVKALNSLLWFGVDENGYGGVFQSQGLQPVRVSTPEIESFIQKNYSAFMNFASAFTYTEAGHTFYVLNFTDGTIVYDLTTKLWHERFSLQDGFMLRAKPQCAAQLNHFGAFSSNAPQIFVGDYDTGEIYVQDLFWPNEAGNPIRRIRTAPHISQSNKWTKYAGFTLDADMGSAQAILDYSNDGGRRFQVGTLAYTMVKSGYDSQGGGGRYFQDQLGRSKDRVFRVTVTSSTELVRFINAYIDVNPGTQP